MISIPLPKLFDFNESLWFLDRNLDDCMHKVRDQEVRRLIVIEGKPVLIAVSQKENHLKIKQLTGTSADHSLITGFVKEWLDMDRDIAPFYKLLKKDPELRHLAVNYFGFRMVGIPDLFETLVWCILGQQINLEFAYRLKRRIVELYGSYVEYDGGRYYIFPPPSSLAELDPGELRKLQVTTRKAEYITGVARMFVNGDLSKEKLQALGSEEAMLAKLMKIRGIGEWTANYTVMKSLRGMNCVPYGDAGVHIALNRLKGIPKKTTGQRWMSCSAGSNGGKRTWSITCGEVSAEWHNYLISGVWMKKYRWCMTRAPTLTWLPSARPWLQLKLRCRL